MIRVCTLFLIGCTCVILGNALDSLTLDWVALGSFTSATALIIMGLWD